MSGDFVQLARDPFARMDFVRRSVKTFASCAWCGGFRMRAGKALRHLFQYGLWRDGARPAWEKTHPSSVSGTRFDLLFCSKSCHDSYHGL